MTAGRAGTIARPPRSWITNWANAYALQAAGGGQAHIACFGDSVTQGYYATTPYYINGWSGQLRAAVEALTGIQAGTGWLPVKDEFQLVDPRTSSAGTWATTSGAGFYQVYAYANDAADSYTLGPIDCTEFKIIYLRNSVGGSFTVKVDGSLTATVSCNGATGVLTQSYPVATGSHTLLIEWASGGNVYPIAVEAVNNATTGVKVSTVAQDSAKSSALISTANLISSRYCLRQMGTIDLAVLAFGLNDSYGGDSVATFKSNMTTLVSEVRDRGASVLILAAPPPNPTHISTTLWDSYRTAMAELSSTLATGFMDMADYWTSYAVSSAYYHDNVHPNNAGHAAMGPLVIDFVIDAIT